MATKTKKAKMVFDLVYEAPCHELGCHVTGRISIEATSLKRAVAELNSRRELLDLPPVKPWCDGRWSK